MLNIRKEDLKNYSSSRVLSLDDAAKLINKLKEDGKKVGLCHGGFDLLHPGHIKHFESAKNLCDILIVSITSDRFISKRKGSSRPIFNETLRAYSIASLDFVDYVVISDFNLGIEVITALKPSYYIKGPDYIGKDHFEINDEKAAIKSVGGKLLFTKDLKLSTTDIIRYIKESV